jgi:hypothetical protein
MKRSTRKILTTLARRAYRRPAAPQDVNALMRFYADGRRAGTFEEGIELGCDRGFIGWFERRDAGRGHADLLRRWRTAHHRATEFEASMVPLLIW